MSGTMLGAGEAVINNKGEGKQVTVTKYDD